MSQDFENRAKAIQRADEELLASLGYKQEFKRAFKPIEVFGVAFSIIGLLPSIASVLFYALDNGGGPAMVWGWLVASIFILVVGLAMAELASAAPTSGGLYFWTYALSSPRWRNLLCWVVGYSNTIGNIAALASIDFGCAIQVMAAVSIGSDGTFVPTAAQTFGVYAAIIVGNVVVCCFGTAVMARLQGIYIVLNVLLCLAVIVALPIATPAEYRNTASFALGDISNLSGWPTGFAFIYSLLAPLWTICSFDSSVHISEEASNAATAVPWGIVGAIAVSGILGTGVNMALAFCMGTDLQVLLDSDQPMAQIFFQSFGKSPTLAIWAIVVSVQFMMGTSMLLSASRQSFAFSRDGALPFSRWIYSINKTTGSPTNAVFFSASGAILMGVLVFAGDQAINSVFALSVAGLYVAYSIPIVARFLGPNDFQPGPFYLGKFSTPVSVIAVLFMAFMGTVFLFPEAPTVGSAGEMNFTVVVLGGVLAISLVYYFLPVYGGRHWFTGPVRTVEIYSEGSSDSIGKEKNEISQVEAASIS